MRFAPFRLLRERFETSSLNPYSMRPIRFIFAIHNHQPVGNFDHLFEQSYQESYLPFLDVFQEYPALKLTLHTSGSLMEWLDKTHPEYVDRLAELVALNRIEIVGGPFFEPILAMLPSRDRIGQIRMYTNWLRNRLGAEIHGLWTPERVWEQSYVRDLSEAEIRYTILDDTHFKSAGLGQNELWKHYNTEDHGKTMFVFPGSETLRYLIPFRNIDECRSFFVQQSEQYEGAVLIHADDGEKFGSWPNTYQTVFEERWLHNFFQMLTENADWIITTMPSEVIREIPPLGTVYLPDGSYREMTEWVLTAENQLELTRLSQELGEHPNWPSVRSFIRGGFWRNFKVRYPESNEMYARMMDVSSQLETKLQSPQPSYEWNTPGSAGVSPALGSASVSPALEIAKNTVQTVPDRSLAGETPALPGGGGPTLQDAQEMLYRSQCNCGFWHGAFGGVYLPHLRNSVYRELIRAENVFDRMDHGPTPWVDAWVEDYNFDSLNEIKLASDHFALFAAPHLGGIMYELDVKPIAQNFLATLNRRPESYHQLVRRAAADSSARDVNGNPVVLKQEGLDRLIHYDSYPRKSLVDLFYDVDVDFNAIRFGHFRQHGSFVHGNYESILRKKYGRIQLLMSCEGFAYGAPIRIQKGITLTAGSRTLEIAYLLENLPREYRMHFATELNFSGLPGHADDRYFETTLISADEKTPVTKKLGNLSTNLDLYNARTLTLVDDWANVKVQLVASQPTHIYAFPIETVNQSEGGFELVHQSVCVQPHWIFEPDENGTWSVDFTIEFDFEQ